MEVMGHQSRHTGSHQNNTVKHPQLMDRAVIGGKCPPSTSVTLYSMS